MITDSKWQWMDKDGKGHGWFSDEAKVDLETWPEFSSDHGHWRPLTPEEVSKMSRMIGQAAYEQS